jgi:hypothetical protein
MSAAAFMRAITFEAIVVFAIAGHTLTGCIQASHPPTLITCRADAHPTESIPEERDLEASAGGAAAAD